MTNQRQWAITIPPSKETVISSTDYRILKFVQLLVSKIINISIAELKKPAKSTLTDNEQIIDLVYQIVKIELNGIDTYKDVRQDQYYEHQVSLDVIKEFLISVSGDDLIINLAHHSEVKKLNQYIEDCNNHKSFVFNLLYNADYTKSAKEIYTWFLEELSTYSPDASYVSQNLNKLLNKIDL